MLESLGKYALKKLKYFDSIKCRIMRGLLMEVRNNAFGFIMLRGRFIMAVNFHFVVLAPFGTGFDRHLEW